MLSVTNSARAYRTYNWTGWDTNAWPSTKNGKVRWSDPNTLVNMTNVWVWKVRQTQIVSVDNGVLPNYSTNGYLYDSKDYASRIAPVYVPAGTSSNSFTNVLTGYYFTRYSTNITEYVTPLWGTIDLDYGDSTITELWTNTMVAKYETNMLLNASDIRAVDTFKGLNYLADIGLISGTNYMSILWKDERDTLHSIKTRLAYNINSGLTGTRLIYQADLSKTEAIAPRQIRSAFDTNYLFDSTDYIARLYTNVADFCNVLNIPSNFFTYTPQRNLAGASVGLPRILTNYYTIHTAASGIVTQNFIDYLGNTNQAVGTNRQEISILVTNTSVADGFTTADYGWKYIPVVLSNLHYTIDEPNLHCYYALTNNRYHAYVGISTAGAGLSITDSYDVAVGNFVLTNLYSLVNRTISGVGDVWTFPYATPVSCQTELQSYNDNQTILINSFADGIAYFPYSLITSNYPATCHLYYMFGRPYWYTNIFNRGGVIRRYEYQTTNDGYSFNVSKPCKKITSFALPTNVAWESGGWATNPALWITNGNLFPTDAEVPGMVNTNTLTLFWDDGAYRGWGYTTNRGINGEGFYLFMIYDWQHPWRNVITN